MAGGVEGDEAFVEGGVDVGVEEEAVEDVEALGVGGAGGPGLDVARAEQLGDGEAGEGAGALPVVEESGVEDVLIDALDDEAFDFGGTGEIGGSGAGGFWGYGTGKVAAEMLKSSV